MPSDYIWPLSKNTTPDKMNTSFGPRINRSKWDFHPPVNVKCLFEGEEEIGSPNLTAFLSQHKSTLAADVAVMSDMPIVAPDRPAITYAMRGGLSLELEVCGPKRDLHSGIFGGAIHNPLQALREIIARLHDANSRVASLAFTTTCGDGASRNVNTWRVPVPVMRRFFAMPRWGKVWANAATRSTSGRRFALY